MWVGTSVPYLSPRATGQADAWSEEAAAAGQSGTQRLREVTTAIPPSDVISALALSPGEEAVVRRRTMFLDGTPVELTDSWYPVSIARGTALAEPRKIKGGAVTLLADLGYSPHEAREEIEFRTATAEEALELNIDSDTPVIALFRTVLTSDGTPFEVSMMTMLPEGRRLRYRLKVG